MFVSCLMPTFNRYPKHGHLVEEAIESFLRQTHRERELLILNDTPGQRLLFRHPRVRIINTDSRYPTLCHKLHVLIELASGDALCRWDDDDISLPWRLEFSVAKLGDRLEWRPENYWYAPREGLREVVGPGNTHCAAIWRRDVLAKIGGYPADLSGGEDQEFNARLARAGVSARGELLAPEEMFYLYRWGVSPTHLSGAGGGAEGIQRHYDRIGEQRAAARGEYRIMPHWREDYVAAAKRAAVAAEIAPAAR